MQDGSGEHYFTSDDLKSSLLNQHIDIARLTPLELETMLGGLSPIVDQIREEEVEDIDGDIVNILSANGRGLVFEWFYLYNGVETLLTTSNKNRTFCSLSASYIRPYIKIWGSLQLSSQYGDPSSQDYAVGKPSVDFTKDPNNLLQIAIEPTVCFAQPILKTNMTGDFDGPIEQWDPKAGFIPQASYDQNFPTMGANNLYFYLYHSGLKVDDASSIQWQMTTTDHSVANVYAQLEETASDRNLQRIKVTLRGPDVSKGSAVAPIFNGPVTIEITGTNPETNKSVQYGFQIKTWFINYYDTRGSKSSWCDNLHDDFYTLPSMADLTNASLDGVWTGTHSGRYYHRVIGEGLASEWGPLDFYRDAHFVHYYVSDPYWVKETFANNKKYGVDLNTGNITDSLYQLTVCRSKP